jgi:hypothetical protein
MSFAAASTDGDVWLSWSRLSVRARLVAILIEPGVKQAQSI